MSKFFYISDSHFFHTNVIAYENRPFSSVEEMNESMIERWNSAVSVEDTVIFGGDLVLASSRNYPEKVKGILQRLNGNKVLIKGNHERSLKKVILLGFQEGSHYKEVEDSGYNIFVIHKLLSNYDRYLSFINRADYVLYGHSHCIIYDDPRVYNKEKFINICVEHLDYIPRTIEELIKIRKQQLEGKVPT